MRKLETKPQDLNLPEEIENYETPKFRKIERNMSEKGIALFKSQQYTSSRANSLSRSGKRESLAKLPPIFSSR